MTAAKLLIVHHTPSPHTHQMFEAVVSGATDPEIEGVEVGYTSGAMKQQMDDYPPTRRRVNPDHICRSRVQCRSRGYASPVKAAFITGAATGIGEALAVRLQRGGWQVFAGYHSSAPDRARWFSLPNVVSVPCDVTDHDQVVAAASTVGEHTGGALDLLINNAGYSPREGVIEAANMTEYRRAFEVNFWGPVQVVQAMMPLLRESKGRVINTTSASVYMTIPMASAYPTAKTALTAFTRHLRMELSPFGIEVTELVPGGVDTPMTEMGPEVAAQQWTLIPEPLREQYRRHFIDGATAIGDSFPLESPDTFADAVWKKIICAKRLGPTYLIGPRQAAVLPWLHRLLPAQQVQNIWRRMFSTKRGA